MHAVHVADDPIVQQLFDLGHVRGVAVVEGDAYLLAVFLFRRQDRLAALSVDGHGFFGDYVAAQFQRADNVVAVVGIHRGYNDNIRFLGFNHPVKVIIDGHIAAGLADVGAAARIDVVNAPQLRAILEVVIHGFGIHIVGAPACAGKYIGLFLHTVGQTVGLSFPPLYHYNLSLRPPRWRSQAGCFTRCSQPFRPSVLIPSTRCFWKNTKIRKIGMIDRVDIANMAPQSDWEVGSEKSFSASDTGYILVSLR